MNEIIDFNYHISEMLDTMDANDLEAMKSVVPVKTITGEIVKISIIIEKESVNE